MIPTNGNGKTTNILLVVNLAGLLGLAVWIANIAFGAGEKNNQIRINQQTIDRVMREGSNGTMIRLNDLERRVNRLEDR